MSELTEKIVNEEANIKDYDINDFDCEEIQELLENDIIKVCDIPTSYAAELIIDGIISLKDYPFDEFGADDQIRFYQNDLISLEDFKKQIDIDSFYGDEYLKLILIDEEYAINALWDELQETASTALWLYFISQKPQFVHKANWAKINKEATEYNWKDFIKAQPQLEEYKR